MTQDLCSLRHTIQDFYPRPVTNYRPLAETSSSTAYKEVGLCEERFLSSVPRFSRCFFQVPYTRKLRSPASSRTRQERCCLASPSKRPAPRSSSGYGRL